MRDTEKEGKQALREFADMMAKLDRPAKVLLVEDDRLDAEECVLEFSKYNAVVRVVATVDDAMQALRSETYDVALVDLNLTNRSGLEVIRRAKESKLNTKFIVLTGSFSLESEECDRAAELGAIALVRKPISQDMVRTLFTTPS